MSREVVKDHNEKGDESLVKSLRKPVHNHVITSSTQSIDDEDVSSLNAGLEANPTSSRPMGSRESAAQKLEPKKTLLGNEGPDASGKVDFSRNPDYMDALVQYHEGSKNDDTEEGFTLTANKYYRTFNRVFSTKETIVKVTAEEFVAALVTFYAANPNPVVKPRPEVTAGGERRIQAPVEEKVVIAQLPFGKSLKIVDVEKVVPLTGEKFEICKILNCKGICAVQKQQSTMDSNGVFYAACGNTDPATMTIPAEKCPQQAQLSAKEQSMFEMFKTQCGGDELKAKKLLYMTKSLYK